ncbi:hypothetical protein P3X46_020182 [Hevea brasiliensis]|uniref:Protein kinase domain-containing protein n=2 Tax=Hevea brasiliensis TaxID=3981 RepID=A0ABQ9LL30_HEVBR|nr:hypothetical protein P3X46_020182 [Hevea brasiliensis]
MSSLYNLKEINLASNSITGSIPAAFFNISKLERVNFASNKLSGNLPLNTAHWLPNLEELDLQQNELSGPIPDSITNASKLTVLDLSYNSFFGFVPDLLGNLRSLLKLNMANNFLTSKSSSTEISLFSSLTSCKRLEYLRFDGNPLNGSLPISVGNLSTSLQYFYVTDCRIKGYLPREIGNLSNLIGLILQKNELTGTAPAEIGRLQYLQDFSVAHNQLEGHIPYQICNLQRLGYLFLRENGFSGSLPSCLYNLTSIRELYLRSNKLTSTIPLALWRLTDLLKVNLSLNFLSGSIRSEIGNLKAPIYIDLSSNQLSGDIPASIGNLKTLAILSLSGNRLQGNIPQSLGDMIGLEFLNLSSNNLSGVIPKSLEKLLNLKVFNVSFNQLQGEIPNGGQFANFSPQSFMGNEALCGSAQMQVPPCRGSNSYQRSKRSGIFLFKYIFPTTAFSILLLATIIIFIRRYKQKAKSSVQGYLLPLQEWRRVSYRELELATDGFEESYLLGKGSFGSVFKVTLSDGLTIAVKVFNLQIEDAFKSFETECELLGNLRHRNLVKIITSCCNLDFKALVLEFMPNWSLEKWLYSHNYFLDILQRLNIMIDVASALEYLHHGYIMPVVHCDLKPSNVLLNEDMVAHVGDFGIAKLLGEGDSMTQTMTLATIGYMAPEFGSKGIVSVRCDVYSYGILLMETFTRKKPTDEMFSGEMNLKNWVKQSLPDALTQVADVHLLIGNEERSEANKECITSILKLALECSADSPEERVGMKDVLANLKKIQLKLKDTEQRHGLV